MFARCEHGLVRIDGDLRILRKKLVLLNDYIQTLIVFESWKKVIAVRFALTIQTAAP